MLPSYQDSVDLLNNVANTNLYKQLIIQLNKDFNLAGIDVVLSLDNSPLVAKETLQKTIKELVLRDFSSYTNLLYHIDISEKDIQNLNVYNLDAYTESVTFLILQRIWKKVWFKNKFTK